MPEGTCGDEDEVCVAVRIASRIDAPAFDWKLASIDDG